MKPELLDVIELLVNLPEHKQPIAAFTPPAIGALGTIVECHDLNHFEVEFSNENGATTALCVLTPQQFMVAWQAKTKQWLTATDKIKGIKSL